MSPRTDLVTVYLPIPAFGVFVAEVEVRIRPQIDHACPGNIDGIVADVEVEGLDGKSYPCSAADGIAILTRIKAEMPDVWREVEEQAETNFKDGATPARAA